MKKTSRRSFIMTALAAAALPAAINIGVFASVSENNMVFHVDKEGNAFLHGAELKVDGNNNASINTKKRLNDE